MSIFSSLSFYIAVIFLFLIDFYSASGIGQQEPFYTNFYSDQQRELQYKIKTAIDRLDHGLQYVPDWPNPDVKFGQVAGVTIDNSGNIVVFHRASNVWDGSSFTDRDIYTAIGDPPISQPTILVFNDTGVLIDQWGEDMFYMPHGITVDDKGNVWVTDVALHQVFKFSPTEKTKPELVLGEKWVPGADERHFCKPAAVAVAASGDFFVADGYCNARVVKFNAAGERLLQWGRRWGDSVYTLRVPHALALCSLGEAAGPGDARVAGGEALCVADRERGRVACFSPLDGSFVAQYRSWLLGPQVFGVACARTDNGNRLYAVTGPVGGGAALGLELEYPSGRLLGSFSPPGGLHAPHAVAASPAAGVLVAEIRPYRLHRFLPAAPAASLAAPVAPSASVAPRHHPRPLIAGVSEADAAPGDAGVEGAAVAANATEAVGGVAGAAAAGAGAAALAALVALLVARARGAGLGGGGGAAGAGSRRRWDYGGSQFKLRRLLERRRFTRVHSDDSEDEPAPMLPPPHAPELA